MDRVYRFLTLLALLLMVIVVAVFTARHIALRYGKTTVIKQTQVIDKTKTEYMTADDAQTIAVLAKRVEAVENKLMGDFIPQSTDRLITNTDPKSPRVIKRGRFDITLDTAGSVGVYGQTSILLPVYNGQFLMPRCDVMIEYAAGFTSYEQLPYTKMNTDGTVLTAAYYSINYQAQPAPAENQVFLTIVKYHRSASLNTSYQGTYIVYSDAWANPNDPESSY